MDIIFRGHHEPGFLVHALGLNQTKKPVNVLPGNQRTDEAFYVCIVPVLDFWRMNKAYSLAHRTWHYASGLEPEILNDVRAGRAVLLFDLCNEGPAYAREIFGELLDWVQAQSLSPGSVVWIAQNRALFKAVRAHHGQRADLVRFMFYDFFVKAMAWQFCSSFGEPVLGNQPNLAIDQLLDIKLKDKLLLCLNATPRITRILTVAALRDADLLGSSLISFPGLDYSKPGASIADVRSFARGNTFISQLAESAHTLADVGRLSIDDFVEEGNALVTKITVEPYVRTFFSVVTESDFSDGSIDRVTEKTVKPFCLGHPAIVIGNPASLAFMTEFGFVLFDNVLDCSFESILDPRDRFMAVLKEIHRQVERIAADRNGWHAQIAAASRANIIHAASGNFLARYASLYDDTILAELGRLLSH